uniref:Uncharacterized protein n=1 Tax=Cucumis melo TaxID=3656 RepID=A0A9I9DTW0_CUCME
MEQLKKKNAETERLHKIEYVAEIQPDEIEKLKGSEMDEDIDVESNDGYCERNQIVKVANY